jgi:hypothetical protein
MKRSITVVDDVKNDTEPLSFFSLPEELIIDYLGYYSDDIHWVFGLLFINRRIYNMMQRCIPKIYMNHPIDLFLDSHNRYEEVRIDVLLRYVAPAITSLDLSSSECRYLNDRNINSLVNLKHLQICNNRYISSRGLSRLTDLTSLKLDYDDTMTDGALMGLTRLQKLSLFRTDQITNHSVKQLTNLQYLNLKGNTNITEEGIVNLCSLEHLIIQRNERFYINKTVPISSNGLCNMTNLRKLELYGYHSSFLEYDGFASLANLKNIGLISW